MKRKTKTYIVVVFCVALAVGVRAVRSLAGIRTAAAGAAGVAPAAPSLPANQTCNTSVPAQPYYVPCNVANGSNASQTDFYNYSWQSFIALNWPALSPSSGGQRGQPDPNQTMGPTGPLVWETYKQNTEVFLPQGAQPADWNTTPSNPCGNLLGAKDFGKVMSVSRTTLNEVNQAGINFGLFLGPLVDQNSNYVVYEVRLNQSEFTYIVNTQYYNATNQIKAVQSNPSTFQIPPKTGQEGYFTTPLPTWATEGAVEIKAAWRVLDPVKDKNNMQRYYTREAYYVSQVSGKQVCQHLGTVGLVGLHILRLTSTTGSTWTWATFEQVDNTEINSSNPPSPPVPSLNPGPQGTPPPPYKSGYCASPAPPCSPTPTPLPAGAPLPTGAKPVNVSRLTPILSDLAQVNSTYQAMLPAPWSYYQLVSVINPNPPASPTPGCTVPFTNNPVVYPNVCVSANTTMESYEQTINCLTCHAKGTPQGTTPNQKFQIFTFLLKEAQPAPSSKVTKAKAAPSNRKSY